MTSTKTILLTGAFGNVGEQVLIHLCQQNHRVFCFDVPIPRNEKKVQELLANHSFEIRWGDLRRPDTVNKIVQEVQPDAILHIAAVIAPISYAKPDVAYDVNVNGTAYLIKAAQALGKPCHFVFASSYATYGSRNGAKNLPPLTEDTPQNPMDNYTWQKVIGEKMVIGSGLPYTILRLCAVMAVDADWGSGPEFRKIMFLIPLAQRRHGGDVRDIALGIANAVTAVEAQNRIFNLAGSDEWRGTAHEYSRRMLEAAGVGMLPAEAFREVNPERDDVWFYEDWVDTREAERVLQFQKHSIDQYFADVRRGGIGRLLLGLIGPLVRRNLVSGSQFMNQSQPDERTIWEHVCEIYGCDPATIAAPPAGYTLPDLLDE